MTEHGEASSRPSSLQGSIRAAEFFAGIGLVRLGLQSSGVEVVWSNDFDASKRTMYVNHFGEVEGHELDARDVAQVEGMSVPAVDLAWGSSPCTDLSVAGSRAGLSGSRSAAFWHFMRVINEMPIKPEIVVLENVIGLSTSHNGKDLREAIKAFNRSGYSVDVLRIDASRFVPQSRPRLFLIGLLTPASDLTDARSEIRPSWTGPLFADPRLLTHRKSLPSLPVKSALRLRDVVDARPLPSSWWSDESVERLVASLSPSGAERVRILRSSKVAEYRTAYRRMRNGNPTWEVRPDDLAGCLRVIRGGSSRQALLVGQRDRLQARWLSPREASRLMGAPNFEVAGLRDYQALSGFGDGVAVPVASWLADNYFIPHLAQLAADRAEGQESTEATSGSAA